MAYRIVASDGQPYGPYAAGEIRKFVAEGRLNEHSLSHVEGEADWKPLGSRPEFGDLFAPPPQSAPPPFVSPEAPSASPAQAAWDGPALPAPGPWGGSSVPSEGPIPWEAKPRGQAVTALVETAKLFALRPAEAWRRTPGSGDYFAPLVYGLALSWVGAVFSTVWSRMLTAPWIAFLPPEARRMMGDGLAAGALSSVGILLVYPALFAIGIFIGTGIFHVCLMVVGGLTNSRAGFEGTFRASAYSSVADLANAVPFFGGLVAAVWKIYLVVVGVVAIHRTTTGKALTAALIPVAVCCLCVGIGIAFGAAALVSAFGR